MPPGTPKTSEKRSLPLGVIRFCEGEVPVGKRHRRTADRPELAVAADAKAGDVGHDRAGGASRGRIAAIGHVQRVAGDGEAVRLHPVGSERADQIQPAIGLDAERAHGIAALVDREEEAAVGRGHHF